MLPDSFFDEVRHELEVWSAAYDNVDAMTKRLAMMDADRAALVDRLDDERELMDKAALAINGFAEQVDSESEKKFVAVLEEYFGKVGAKMEVS